MSLRAQRGNGVAMHAANAKFVPHLGTTLRSQ